MNTLVHGEQEVRNRLFDHVTHALAAAGHPEPTEWFEDFQHKNPEMVFEVDNGMVRFMINSYWRNKLGRLSVTGGVNTQQARYSLIDQGGEREWLQLFTDAVVPTIITNNL